MARKANKSDRSIEAITDEEVSAAIQYLDPDTRIDDYAYPDSSVPVIYFSLLSFVRGLGGLHVPFPPNG